MRWAGSLLCCCVGLVACGGRAPADAAGDGGSNTVVTPDGGSDGGPAAECSGVVPPAPGTAIAFDVPAVNGETCGATAIDGDGTVAADAESSSDTAWFEFGTNGAHTGTFNSPVLFAQPKGFIGLSAGKDALMVMFWNLSAEPTPSGVTAAALGPAFGSGVISLSVTTTELTVHKHDAQGVEGPSAKIPGAYVPRGAAEDASGAVLALTGSGTEVSGIWVDLASGKSGRPFSIGSAAAVRARPLLGGGVAVRLDSSWAGVIQPGESTLRPAPAWLGDSSDFVPVRSGKAYALLKPGNTVELVSVQGNACGKVTFPGVSSVAIGVDGSAVGSTGQKGCTKFVWRDVLR
jgi:hypothetical protein